MTTVTASRPVSCLTDSPSDFFAALSPPPMALHAHHAYNKPQLLLPSLRCAADPSTMSQVSSAHRLREFNLEGYFHHIMLHASRFPLQRLQDPSLVLHRPCRSRSIKRVDRHRPPSRSSSGPRSKKSRSHASAVHANPAPATPAVASTPTPTTTSTASPRVQYRQLSSWDQTSPRGHVRNVLCFGLDKDASSATITTHLTASLQRAASSQPEFAGTLLLDAQAKGRLVLRLADNDTIPLLTEDATRDFGMTFAELRSRGFPADAFVGERFSLGGSIVEGGSGTPVAVIKAIFIDGGLLLLTYLHHAMADGTAVARFLDYISSHTRSQGSSLGLRLDLDESDPRIRNYVDQHTEEELLAMCPEFTKLETLTGPTQPNLLPGGVQTSEVLRTGKIFRFPKYRLDALQASLRSAGALPANPSSYTALAGLSWAHITKARLAAERGFASDEAQLRPARLMNPVNWKNRALPGTSKDYFGNATALSFTTVSMSKLKAATDDFAELASLVQMIGDSIHSIDDDFVCKRAALFRKMEDSRTLGLDLDPRTPQDLGFNTWRHFGGDTEWHIPGIQTSKPEALRRAQDVLNFGGALLLPAQASSDVQELLITLPTASMELLLQDQQFMAWVDDVV